MISAKLPWAMLFLAVVSLAAAWVLHPAFLVYSLLWLVMYVVAHSMRMRVRSVRAQDAAVPLLMLLSTNEYALMEKYVGGELVGVLVVRLGPSQEPVLPLRFFEE